MSSRWPRRVFRGLVLLAAFCGLVALNGPTLVNAGRDAMHDYKINSPDYKAEHGHWSALDVPEDMRVNAIHAAVLRTGKVLIIAGSGNDRKNFDAGTFKTILWDPKTDKYERVRTPSDMFCAGHAFLPDGKLLIAGGTSRYEKLEEDVKHAAGAMTIKNEDPDAAPVTLERGAELVSAEGHRYRTTKEVTVRPAGKVVGPRGVATVTASETEVWVEAVERGEAPVIEKPTQFRVAGVDRRRSDDVYGFSEYLTTEKQEYWGDDTSYLFDPETERYERVEDMDLARWYPTLVGLRDGKVLSVSGLDEFGRIIDGENEIYDPATKRWTTRPDIKRTFPTYPSLFLMPGGDLFYTGSNAGYGSDKVGRDPGIWDLGDNSFQKVPGLRDPDQTETSGSVLLPPAQDQRYMVAGGGGIGESNRSTARTDVVDLRRRRPRFEPGPNLAEPVRYPNMVLTPDDKVMISGGSKGYRGQGNSDVLLCQLYDPKSGRMSRMADPTVGRNYHSQALLLPDGRMITMGSDPLYSDAENTKPGRFEKRIEIYSPPYLFNGERPRLTGGPESVRPGGSATFTSPDAGKVSSARLMRPSAVTHVTDVEQRSIELGLAVKGDELEVKVPEDTGLVPRGWYMLFVTTGDGVPSEARWVHVD